MTLFPSSAPIRAVIIGGRGSIGGAFVKHLAGLKSGNVETIVCTSRDLKGLEDSSLASSNLVKPMKLDPTCEDSFSTFVKNLKDQGIKPNLIFNATGMLHLNTGDQSTSLRPETSFKKLSKLGLTEAFNANLLTNGLALKFLLGEVVDKSVLKENPNGGVFAVLSAKVGSTSGNEVGGWYSYRAQKSATNSLIKTASIEAARSHPNWRLLSLHPGTVVSDLSEPFVSKAKREKLISSIEQYEKYIHENGKGSYVYWTPDCCASKLYDVMNESKPEDTGKFMDYTGTTIPY